MADEVKTEFEKIKFYHPIRNSHLLEVEYCGRRMVPQECIERLCERLVITKKENIRLLKCEQDLREIHEERMAAVKEAGAHFSYLNGELMLIIPVNLDEII